VAWADDRGVSPFALALTITRRIAILFVFGCGGSLFALQMEGTVEKVFDGRTVFFVDSKNQSHLVILMGVDVPEPGQSKFWDSTRTLGLVLRKRKVLVDWYRLEQRCSKKLSPDCAKIAKVLRHPDGLDPALHLIQRGLGWHNPSTLNDQSTTDRRLYQEAEQIAQFKRLGIWKALKPEPPWEYRKRHPSASAADIAKVQLQAPKKEKKSPAKKPKKAHQTAPKPR
jgi:micrococcal nuclease